MTWLSTCHDAPIVETDEGSKCTDCRRFCNIWDADMYSDPISKQFIASIANKINKVRRK